MLVIRMQRTGRKGHAQFRVVVQDSRRTPTSGKIVAQLGHYNPHNKQTVINKEKAKFYLEHGAQPSDRAARLLKAEGVKLPKWVSLEAKKKGKVRNPEKLRKNRPAESAAPAPAEEKPAETEATAENEASDTPAAEEPKTGDAAEEKAPAADQSEAPENKNVEPEQPVPEPAKESEASDTKAEDEPKPSEEAQKSTDESGKAE